MNVQSKSAKIDNGSPMHVTNILAPTDFSAGADRAFAYAVDLARRHGATVHLMHVIGPLEGDAYSPLRFSPEAQARHETPERIAYDQLQARIMEHSREGITIEPVVRHGSSVIPTLLQYARTEGIDLIVMGTHGRQGMQRFFMGSVAERVVREAPCSVLTVHEPSAEAGGEEPAALHIERILVPLDFSEHAEALLHAAEALAAAYDAQLDLLYVIEPIPFMGALTGVMTANDLVPNVKKLIREKLKHLRESVSEEVQVKLHVEEGHAAANIVDFAARCGTDLIVIASQGRSGVERFLIGSVAERVVRAASCPVLTFKQASAATAVEQAQGEEEAAMVED